MDRGQQFPEDEDVVRHVAPRGFRDSILKKGLVPSIPGANEGEEEDLEHPPGVYYTERHDPLYWHEGDVWEFSPKGLKGSDSPFAIDSLVGETVPPDRLRLAGHSCNGEFSPELAENCKDCANG